MQSPSRIRGLAVSQSTESVSEFYDAAQSLHSSDTSEVRSDLVSLLSRSLVR